MDKALYVAMTGAQASLRAQAAVSHNLANVSTTGFKQLLHQTQALPIDGAGLPTRVNTLVEIGGFKASAGVAISTGNPLDFALQRDTQWMAVQARDGSEAYTRAADLRVDVNGLLVNSQGDVALDIDGLPLAVPPHQSISIGADGTVSIIPQGEAGGTSANVGRLKLVEIQPGDLRRGEDGHFRLRQGAEATPAVGNVLMSGLLEGSNVNPTEQLVQMISFARQFEMNVKLIETANQNAQSANSLLRAR